MTTTTLTAPVATSPVATCPVNGDRLWGALMDLAQIGATPKGGSCRLALTAEDGAGRDLVCGWMRDAGLAVQVDEVGNIFGIRPGQDNSLPPVMTGSHIDTQPTGGKFDGCYGVMAGLEVMRTLQQHKVQTQAPLALAIWTNEEGSRFVPVMMGSGVHCDIFGKDVALQARDHAGISVAESLQAIGYAGTLPVGQLKPASYIEAHIEQGPILEAKDTVIGVVTGSLGLRWYDVTVTGMEAHAGPTPMELRQDALYAAASLMRTVVDIANADAFSPDGRGTVGEVHVHPNSRNVIPGQVRFTVDLRHPKMDQLNAMEAAFRSAAAALQAEGRVQVQVVDVQEFPATPFADELVSAVAASAAAHGYSHMPILTGAGHDAVYMARRFPTAMIFVPCKDGISHNEIEDAQPAHLAAGCQVLCDVMLAQAGVVAA
ncbi:Zn-dependent hydrolase [Comamonas aquatica]|uniref:Zn-dependent hydrolase n=1 Tax=Comamonas aquatica TaxID=225991 RepID=UPI0005AA1750|nr:Zn-dependent hydrolase [Comamonas aquatica]MDH0495178.1 Zn-dependent hydrolase [Comamonas aquatica]